SRIPSSVKSSLIAGTEHDPVRAGLQAVGAGEAPAPNDRTGRLRARSEQVAAGAHVGRADLHRAAGLPMRDSDRHARRLPGHHVVDRIAIAAQPANQPAAGQTIAAMVRVALAAGVEHGMHGAVVAARQDKADALTGAVVVAEQLGLAAAKLAQGYRQRL